MKIKAVEKIVKNNRRIEIRRESDEGPQWLGDGCAFYPLHGFPLLDENTIFRFFDIADAKQEKFTYQEGSFPVGVDVSDNSPADKLATRSDLVIIDSGMKLIPLYTNEGVMFINAKYLEPFADEENGVELYARKGFRQTLIAVKAGFLLAGLIAPVDFKNGSELRKIAARFKEPEKDQALV